MRIGIYGGTFDPVHLAHLVLAEQCREQAQLDEVWFLPAARPPHKAGVTISDTKHRMAMLEFAISGHPQFRVNPLELERAGPSYTVETLRELVQQQPDVEWSLLMGGDSLRDFHTWREPAEIATLARIVAVNRGLEDLPGCAEFRASFGDRLDIVEMPGLEISASDIRARIASERSIRFLVPRAVEVYIQQQRLYRSSPET